MKSVNTWNLTNNKLHQLFKENNEFISIKVRGNTWEPITRWMKLDSRIFRETTSKARITLCDIESLAEIYNYRSIRWTAKKLTPLPTKLIPGTSLFVTIFVSAIVTVLHAFYYGTIDLVLVFVLILGSIIGVQFGQKIGEKVDSSEFKTILAVLLLLVGIAIAYDTFIKEDVIVETVANGTKNLGNIAQFILDYSKDLPVFYGLTSVVLAVVLGIGAAILRNYISKWNKAREAKLKA